MSSLLVFPCGKSVVMVHIIRNNIQQLFFADSCFPLVSVLIRNFHCHLKGVSTYCLAFNYFSNYKRLFLMFHSCINENLKPEYPSLPSFSKDQHDKYSLVDFQLDAQNSYLFTYNTFIKILHMFRVLPCSSSGGLRRNCIYAASGIVTLCRWLSCATVKKLRQRHWNFSLT
jgi:hypothetical protein